MQTSDFGGTSVADTGLVSSIVEETYNSSKNIDIKKGYTPVKFQKGHASQIMEKSHTNDMPLVRTRLAMQGISKKAQNIICDSWRTNTKKQYSVYIQKWEQFCSRQHFNPMATTVNNVLNFFVELYDDGLGYSAINTARSALSNIVTIDNVDNQNITIGHHPLICRFIKGVFESRPALPKYTHTWNVETVLKYLKTLESTSEISLKDLTLKLVMLIALLSGQRCQSIHSIKTNNIILEKDKVTIPITDVIKQSKPQRKQPVLVFPVYKPDTNLCVVSTIRTYLHRTKDLRNDNNNMELFLTTVKPYSPASKATIARWIRTVLDRAGIDIQTFHPHSVRSASASAVARKKVPIGIILKNVGWKSSSIFGKFYNLPLEGNSDNEQYANAIYDEL